MSLIEVTNLTKDFLVPEKKTGLLSFLLPKEKKLRALDHVSFTVEKGQILGYIGPNGSGKSTTIKLLTGILVPTEGEARVSGFVPWKERETYTHHIGVVFGQKSLLWWDIAPEYCFRLYKGIYEMSEDEYQKRLSHLVELLDVSEFMHIPTRKLSLGQRMRCELVAALIHQPEILFLDEPTIGLDVVAKQRMREAIQKINKEEKTTVFLTTHDMGDIEQLAHRIIVLDKGKIVYEGDQHTLRKEIIHENEIHFEIDEVKDQKKFEAFLSKHRVMKSNPAYIIRVDTQKNDSKKVMDELFKCCTPIHFEIREPSLETVIRELYEHQSSKKR